MYIQDTSLSKTKQAILDSALTLFVEKGYFNTSIPDLVKHSGISTGSIYHSFTDKGSIAESLIEALLTQIESEQLQILSRCNTSWDRFYQLCKWMFDTAQQHPHAVQFTLNARHKEFMPDALPICSAKPFMILRSVIQQAMDEGELQKIDVMLATANCYGGVLRLVQLHLDNRLDHPIHHYLDDITRISWNSIATSNQNKYSA